MEYLVPLDDKRLRDFKDWDVVRRLSQGDKNYRYSNADHDSGTDDDSSSTNSASKSLLSKISSATHAKREEMESNVRWRICKATELLLAKDVSNTMILSYLHSLSITIIIIIY